MLKIPNEVLATALQHVGQDWRSRVNQLPLRENDVITLVGIECREFGANHYLVFLTDVTDGGREIPVSQILRANNGLHLSGNNEQMLTEMFNRINASIDARGTGYAIRVAEIRRTPSPFNAGSVASYLWQPTERPVEQPVGQPTEQPAEQPTEQPAGN